METAGRSCYVQTMHWPDVITIIAVVGTILGVLIPLIGKLNERVVQLENRMTTRFERVEAKLDQFGVELVQVATNAAVAKDRTERRVG